ncbi:uncharacterized protein LOC143214797 isoform X4 [Lasioglossum baleicum]|uniref:uncharacterized protein LOC143214797 isoform X4 n=1 Tax=Lasioglossum baleicum TaxID=434251 RepID=UPI003FCEAAA3
MRGDLQEDKQLRYNYDRFNNEQTLDAYANIGSYELINGNWSASQRFIWYVKDSVKIRMKGNLINDSNGSGTWSVLQPRPRLSLPCTRYLNATAKARTCRLQPRSGQGAHLPAKYHVRSYIERVGW